VAATLAAFEGLLAGPVPVRVAIGAMAGALNGSFLATVVIRWPRERSAMSGRSACDHCGRTLRAWELVPVLSFLAAGGRCRTCKGSIDRRHFYMELAAILIGVVALLAHPGLPGLATALLGWWLLVIAALDAEHHWLPDALTLPLLAAGLGIAWIGVGPPIEARLIGALLGFLILAGMAWAYRRLRGREGMGGGDPKLLGAIGAWLGWAQLPFVLTGAGLLGLAALLMIRLRGTASRRPTGCRSAP
jgi:leader peptidase (prepilin peptidase)/N-methyltransferase